MYQGTGRNPPSPQRVCGSGEEEKDSCTKCFLCVLYFNKGTWSASRPIFFKTVTLARTGKGLEDDDWLTKRSVLKMRTQLHSCAEWAGLQNADFLATDSGSPESNVVLRIVGQSVARASLGH